MFVPRAASFSCCALLLLASACGEPKELQEEPRFVKAQLLAANRPWTEGEMRLSQPDQLRDLFVGCYEVSWASVPEVPSWARPDSKTRLLRLEGSRVSPEGGFRVTITPATRVVPTWRLVDAYSAEVTWGLAFEAFQLRLTLAPSGVEASSRRITDTAMDSPFAPARAKLVPCK